MIVLIGEARWFEDVVHSGGRLKNPIGVWLREAPWLNRKRIAVYPKLVLVVYLLTITIWLMAGRGLIDPMGKPIGPDFINYYAASAQTLAGHPAAAYDLVSHGRAERAAVGDKQIAIHLFDYPPTLLLIILPLAIIPYLWSFIAWTVLTTGGYLALLGAIAPAADTLWLTLAFPGTWMNALSGQNAFLSSMLLGGGLLTLESRPLLAGALFGLLTYKPQLMLLVPIVLVATGRWRALFAAAITALAFAGLSLLLFGADSWRGFFRIGSVAYQMLIGKEPAFHVIQQAVFAGVRFWGLPVPICYAIQLVSALLAGVAVIWVWYQPVSFRIKAAVLVTGAMIVTPYLNYYDLALLALPIAWLGYEGLEGEFLPYEKTALCAVWLLPLVYTLPLAPWVIIPFFALIVRRARVSREPLSAVG